MLMFLSLTLPQGPHECFWRVPSLLRIEPTQYPLPDLMDRINTIIPLDLHWSVDRTPFRRRLFPGPPLVGRISRGVWLYDDEYLQRVLANHAGARSYHRLGIGMLIHPLGRNTTTIFCQETSPGEWHSSKW